MQAKLTIAHLTLVDARRRRIVTAALLCAAAFLTVFTAALFFVRQDLALKPGVTFIERQAVFMSLALAGLYATNFLSVLFAVLLPVDALSGEIESGVMQTIAVKPVSRSDILVGKWLGHGLIAVAYLLTLATGVIGSVRLMSGLSPSHLPQGLSLMALEVMVLVTISIAGGTRFSTVTNGITALGFYGVAFIGGWIEQVGIVAHIESVRLIGIVASLISPTDSLWRFAAYQMQPAIVRDFGPAALFSLTVPTMLMVWWAAGYLVVTLAWGVRTFKKRQL